MTDSSLLNSLAINPEGFIFSPQTGESFTANQTGIDILLALQKGETAEDIVVMMAKKYEASKEDITNDVRDFIDHLRALKIIWRA